MNSLYLISSLSHWICNWASKLSCTYHTKLLGSDQPTRHHGSNIALLLHLETDNLVSDDTFSTISFDGMFIQDMWDYLIQFNLDWHIHCVEGSLLGGESTVEPSSSPSIQNLDIKFNRIFADYYTPSSPDSGLVLLHHFPTSAPGIDGYVAESSVIISIIFRLTITIIIAIGERINLSICLVFRGSLQAIVSFWGSSFSFWKISFSPEGVSSAPSLRHTKFIGSDWLLCVSNRAINQQSLANINWNKLSDLC